MRPVSMIQPSLAKFQAQSPTQQHQLEQRRKEALAVAKQCEQVLREQFKVTQVILFGSVTGQSPWHENSDLDIELDDGCDDATYLKYLDSNLPRLIDEVKPDFIFFQSGVDVLATDKLGRLGMTIQGCKTRDKMVFEICYKNKIPVVASMGGGYSPKISHILEAHANTYRVAQEIFF